MVFVGVVGNGIAYGLWFAIVRRLSAVTASLGVLSVPVIGVIASVVILGERPTVTDIVGFALIFAASACVMLTRPPPALPSPRPAEGREEPLRLDALRQFRDARHHRALRIGQRVDDGEMVRAGDLLVAGLRRSAKPAR